MESMAVSSGHSTISAGLFTTTVRFKVGENVRTQVVDTKNDQVIREMPADLKEGLLGRVYA